MPEFIDKLTDHHFARKLAKLLIPHPHNNHHPYLIRHESLFLVTLVVLVVQFFSFSTGGVAGQVLGYATNITRAAVITLTNQERTTRGLAPLAESSQLNNAATQKAQHMFAHNYWAHFAPDGTSPWFFFKQAGYSYTWAGENLARDFSTSEGVVNGWMNSPSHRDNMLNPNFNDIGIGVEDGTLQGSPTTLVVQHMGKVQGASTASSGSPSTSGSQKAVAGQPAKIEDELPTPQEKESGAPVASSDVQKVNEKISGASYGSFNLTNFWENLTLGQRITLALLSVLVSVFVVDSVILFRKGHERQNSHSILHAGVLVILMVVLVKSATGGVL